MSKELEALENMKNRLIDAKFTINGTTLYSKNKDLDEDYKLLCEALHRLESIDNAEPSEALDCLEELRDFRYGKDKLLVCQTEMYNTIKQALLKAQEQEKELERYKVLEKELKSEINVLFSYMEFTKLFFEIFNLEYSNETFTLSLIPSEQYNIENVDLKICLIKEDADKILKVAELLEKEDKSE